MKHPTQMLIYIYFSMSVSLIENFNSFDQFSIGSDVIFISVHFCAFK